MAEGMPDDFAGFYIGHSIDHGGDYALDLDHLLPPGTREITDDRAIATKANYYIVVAVDTADNVSASLPALVQLNDSIPPAPPVNFRVVAIDDTTGRVEFSWDSPEAADLYAYRVYRKHNRADTWVLRNDDLHFGSTYVDTLNLRSLTIEVFYQVVALDFSFNASAASEPFRIPLPDLIPPVTPVFTEAVPSDSSVALAWSRSPSFDVVGQTLYRRLSTEAAWVEIADLPTAADSYLDLDVTKLRTYEYTMQVTDSTGFRSNFAVPVKGRVFDNGVRPGIVALTAVADTTAGVIRLSWDYPVSGDGEYWFVVYRGLSNEEPTRYRSTGVETLFEDRRVRFRSEEAYQYAVQVMYRNGGASPLSEVVPIEYPRRDR
jgi:fibronectin type 3 domain-containing protein